MRQNDGNCSVCVCVESLRERDQRRRSGIGRLIRQPEEQQFRLVSASRFDGGIFLLSRRRIHGVQLDGFSCLQRLKRIDQQRRHAATHSNDKYSAAAY